MKRRTTAPTFAAIIGCQCGDLPVAGYIRRSDDDQSAFSPEAQERIVRGACASWGLRAPTIYADDDVSGGAWQRPGFDRLKADVAAGRVRIVVVPKIDRFARDVILCLQTVDAFHAAGAAVMSVAEPLDFASPFGRKSLTDAASTAEWYRRNLSTEVSKGLREKAQQGYALGLAPYGMRRVHEINPRTGERIKGTDRLEPTDDLPVVLRLYTTYADGDHSDTTLAALLNGEGYTHLDPQNGRRKPFTRDTVRKILTNPIYAGWVEYCGERYEGRHGQLVSRDLWEQCQAIRDARAKSKTGRVNQHGGGALLSGLAVCARCGAPMHAWTSAGSGRVYHCKTRRQQGVSACAASLVPEPLIEAHVRSLLGYLVLPDEVVAAAVAAARDLVERPAPPPAPDRSSALAVLKADFLADRISAAEYERKRSALLDAPAPEAPRPMVLDVAAAARRARDLPALFEHADLAGRRSLLRAVIARAEIDKARGIVAVTPAGAYGPILRACAELVQRLRVGSGEQGQPAFPLIRDAA